MTERPILFSGDMIRAILAGRKTQTRRVVKPQPPSEECCGGLSVALRDVPDSPLWFAAYEAARDDSGIEYRPVPQLSSDRWKCPYGNPGDTLWVRETWGIGGTRLIDPCLNFRADGTQANMFKVKPGWWRRAEGAFGVVDDVRLLKIREGWRPSIHMPRWASRITLQVTDVRGERVQDISEEDARAEGFAERHWSYRRQFAELWDSINAKRGYGWDTNPWVWVVKFEVRS